MTLFYSKSTGGFYDNAIHTLEQIPIDALPITAEAHKGLLLAQEDGQIIQSSEDGMPVAVDPPQGDPYPDFLTKLSVVRALISGGFSSALTAGLAGMSAIDQIIFNSATLVGTGDVQVIGFIAALGADPQEIFTAAMLLQ